MILHKTANITIIIIDPFDIKHILVFSLNSTNSVQLVLQLASHHSSLL